MKPLVLPLVIILLAGSTAVAQTAAGTSAAVQTGAAGDADLSKAERAAGWKSLFDGKTPSAWRAYRKPDFPDKGWIVEGGLLKCTAGGGDIITRDSYSDFEFAFEFKVSPKGNSGVMYRVAETHDATWKTGPEYQVLDDAGHAKQPSDWQSTGALYELASPAAEKKVRPVGEFNEGRIRVRDNVIQHWLNGLKVVECRMDTPDWRDRINASKFKAFDGFGVQPAGHIALQDHGNEIWYRNLRIRDLAAAPAGEIALFNGRDLDGWSFAPGGEAPFRVEEGVLICAGEPTGYLRTKAAYKSYILRFDWRWSPVTRKTGNSGVLLRISGEDRVWPRCVEAQLQHERAGDFWNLGGVPMKTDAGRTNGGNTRARLNAERAPGAWNDYEIVVDGGRIALWVNGELVNEATEVEQMAGPIGFQSEGTEIHFRRIRLIPLE